MNEMNAQEKENILNEVHWAEDAAKLEIQKLRNDIKELKELIVLK